MSVTKPWDTADEQGDPLYRIRRLLIMVSERTTFNTFPLPPGFHISGHSAMLPMSPRCPSCGIDRMQIGQGSHRQGGEAGAVRGAGDQDRRLGRHRVGRPVTWRSVIVRVTRVANGSC
ncbi:MAG: hypothetical protein F4194_05690 [Acidimicrobiia bacterium]|nr:hypothetical protein [bacterium]MYA38279.1 hypothetical protein [Acidimicrobiia bacterium]MYH05958.1 hypothetical protein [Acidimicrobiia bacterium]